MPVATVAVISVNQAVVFIRVRISEYKSGAKDTKSREHSQMKTQFSIRLCGAEYLERSGRLRKGACRNPYRAGHVAGECPCRMRSGSFDPTNPSSGRFVCRVEPRP